MAPTMRDFHLTILDQTVLRMYVRHLLIFPFPDPKDSKDAIRALRAGVSTTLVQFPFLAGTITSLNERADQLGLQYPDPITEELIDQIFIAKFDLADDRKFDFETMEAAGFPPSDLPPDAFCPEVLRNHPGLDDAFAEGPISFKTRHSVPVFAARATFIPGGLVLSVYSNHSVVDGNGIAQVYRTWSACIRSQSNTKIFDSSLDLSTPLDSAHGRNVTLDSLRRLFDNFAGPTEPDDCPEVRYPGTPPRAPALRSSPYDLVAKIFVFPASIVSNLTKTLSSITNIRVSSFTALIALLWMQVTVARSSSLMTKSIQDTKLCIAFDHRKNLGKDYTESYLGNCATGTIVSTPISTMLPQTSRAVDAEHLAPIALNIIHALSPITLEWLRNRLSLFSRTPNSNQLTVDVDIPNGPDLFVTSWMHMGADCVWDIPGTTCQVPYAIRKPQSKIEGNIHILPRSKVTSSDKAFEILLCLEKGEMEKTTNSLEKEGWIERVISA